MVLQGTNSQLVTAQTIPQPANRQAPSLDGGNPSPSMETNPNKYQPEPAQLDKARELADQINKTLLYLNTAIEFRVDEQNDQIVLNVVDNESGDIILQIPSKDMLAIPGRLENKIGILLQHLA